MKLAELTLLVTLILSLALMLTFAYNYLAPTPEVRNLALFYLITTYNPQLPYYTVNSPEAVTAIVWDYRGLDTLFETAVFYLALIAGLALARRLYRENPVSFLSTNGGLSIIVKTVTKITSPMIIAVGASIGLHGHLTPGGGFQGGATIAVAPMVIIITFSVFYLLTRKVTTEKMLLIRSIGLIGIGLTAISVFIIGLAAGRLAFVFQNMPKANAPMGLPGQVNGVLISGTLWFFNLFEMLAVAAGFTMAFAVLMLAGKER
ncbi:MAG: MnhB domain-containing protein [Desulfurococcaceae archaeon]